MSAGTKVEVVSTLAQAKAELCAMARVVDGEIGLVANAFESLTGHADAILRLAAAMVGCIESESVSSVLPKVQTLGAAARGFVEDRLQAITGILETVTAEVKLLQQLSLVATSQETIALKIKALSTLTNIEVAHLGTVGAGFHYLVNELADFSNSVTRDTRELAHQTASRRVAIEDTQCVLSAELPSQREQLARIEADLGSALAVVDRRLTQLSETPVQFRMCLEGIARQIAGVVAAIQAHDITRQQIEHVQGALLLIAAKMPGNADRAAPELSQVHAGLTIQIYQLRTIKETVANWATQIKACMSGIMRVTTSEVVGIAPVVLEQEREVSSQLAQIERLERQSRAYSERIESNLGGLSTLLHLVSEHLQRAKSIGDRLRFLAFNSIIEASHVGTQAGVILAISNSIKEVSAEWNRITDESGQAMQEFLNLELRTNQVTKTFSEASNERLRETQAQTMACLDNLRTAGASAAKQAQDMKVATEKMQAKSADAGSTGDRLDACFRRIDSVLSAIEEVRRQLEIDYPAAKERYDAAEVERLFSAFYTTEMEREVLRAALGAKAMPAIQTTFAGNSIELF